VLNAELPKSYRAQRRMSARGTSVRGALVITDLLLDLRPFGGGAKVGAITL